MKTFLLLFAIFFQSLAMAQLTVGDKAPPFSLTGSDGKTHKLSDYQGKWLALYFYPMDNTFSCTAQAKNIRDGMPELKKNQIEVLGISVDSLDSHQSFQKKLELNFILLSDETKDIARSYGAKAIYGVAKRYTYIIDPDQKIAHVITDVDVNRHTEQIVNAVKKIRGN